MILSYYIAVCVSLGGIVLGAALPSNQTIRWVDCSKHVPDTDIALNLTGIDLSALPSTLHCGQLEVPMDYSRPISSTNNITLGLAMYRPKEPKGVIFYNPGGTDAAAVWAWKAALNQTSSSTPDFNGLLEFDLMMADTRGTFSSNELNVSIEVVVPLLDPYPTNQSGFDAFRQASKAVFQSFVNSSTPPGIVQHVGTRESVQDFESLRVALGYDKIHFLGCSTGSYRVAQYASQYPEHVGRFVLDAISPHGMTIFNQSQYDVAAVNRALLRADAYCQNNASCPFHSQGKGSVPKIYQEIVAAAQNSSSSAAFELQYDFLNLVSGQPDFPQIFEAFEALLQGQSLGSDDSSVTLAAVVGIPIICSDITILENTFAGFQQDLAAMEKARTPRDIKNTPLISSQSGTMQFRLWCAGWPYPTAPLEPLNITAPMLLVTADFDVATPTEKATFQWQQAPNSVLLVRHGDDHVSFNEPDLPTAAIMRNFLSTGSLPAAMNGTQISIYHPGMHRGPIPDPYDVPTGLVAGDIDSAENGTVGA
ncbi:hypothetical protein EDD36DRAFT_484980 [Exophiala viscosa]|uniref:AB hydrolase-1 domain-containing protein n=1 Tax=Exophiala viscosa TaxID=2486360 RepID=A0AAN6E612_9EURO|nr:hypothetical protein EDD36DRAFT_484980 [Exophiala viscosa]